MMRGVVATLVLMATMGVPALAQADSGGVTVHIDAPMTDTHLYEVAGYLGPRPGSLGAPAFYSPRSALILNLDRCGAPCDDALAVRKGASYFVQVADGPPSKPFSIDPTWRSVRLGVTPGSWRAHNAKLVLGIVGFAFAVASLATLPTAFVVPETSSQQNGIFAVEGTFLAIGLASIIAAAVLPGMRPTVVDVVPGN